MAFTRFLALMIALMALPVFADTKSSSDLVGYASSSVDVARKMASASGGATFGAIPIGRFSLFGSYSFTQIWDIRGAKDGQTVYRVNEREHLWRTKGIYQLSDWGELGVWSEIQLATGGEDASQHWLGDDILLIPWYSQRWTLQHVSTIALPILNSYDYMLPDLSYRTAPLAALLAHSWTLPEQGLSFLTRLAYWPTLANDPWEDSERRSLSLQVSYLSSPRLKVMAATNLYSEIYQRPYPQAAPHSNRLREQQRNEQGYEALLALSYELGFNCVASGGLVLTHHLSPSFPDKEFTRSSVMISLSVTLPKRPFSLVPDWWMFPDRLAKGGTLARFERFDVNILQ